MTNPYFDPKAVAAQMIARGLAQTPAQIAEARKAERMLKAKQARREYARSVAWKKRIPAALHKKPGPKPKNPIGPMFSLNTASKLKKA